MISPKFLIGIFFILLVICTVLAAISSYYWSNSKVQAKIHEAELNMAKLEAENQRLNDRIKEIDDKRVEIEQEIASLQAERDSIKIEIANLEQERIERENALDNLFQPAELSEKMRETFPELGDTPLLQMEYDEDGDGFGIEYFMIPTQFVATFIADHQNAENYKEQNEKFELVSSNCEQSLQLSSEALRLADEKAEAYQESYQNVYNQYQELNKDYITILKQPPKLKLGFPSMTTILGAAAVGMAAGMVISN